MSSSVMFEVIPAGLVIVPITPALFCIYLYTVRSGVDPCVVEAQAGLRFMMEGEAEDPMLSLDVKAYGSSAFAGTNINA